MAKVQTSVYLPEEIMDSINKVKDKEHRGSVNNALIYLLSLGIKEYEKNV